MAGLFSPTFKATNSPCSVLYNLKWKVRLIQSWTQQSVTDRMRYSWSYTQRCSQAHFSFLRQHLEIRLCPDGNRKCITRHDRVSVVSNYAASSRPGVLYVGRFCRFIDRGSSVQWVEKHFEPKLLENPWIDWQFLSGKCKKVKRRGEKNIKWQQKKRKW